MILEIFNFKDFDAFFPSMMPLNRLVIQTSMVSNATNSEQLRAY